ncbi:P-loop NTPase fold protein [Streptomyces sp. V4-01]|uniref:P-loop NTPase fold protein n=1 Tax=Actinacidiphila polyblastidii TaxID=3110430 RepID=A0ABU7PDW5_9ACTN|nr:P-loop NTPase fold protein [Streptomyces sp. V4-01]
MPLIEPGAGRLDLVVSMAWVQVGQRRVLATGNHDGTVRLWELHEEQLVPLGAPVTAHTDWVRSVAWVQVGQRRVLATGSDDRTVRLWELHEDRLVPLGEPVAGHTGWVWSVAWVQVGRRRVLATGSSDGTVRLWELHEDRLVPLGEPVTGHTGSVVSVAWVQVGRRRVLATGSSDGTVRLWELHEEQLVPLGEPVTAHTGSVEAVAWVQAGRRRVLAAGSHDGAVRLWELHEDRLVPLGEPVTAHTGWVVSVAWVQVGQRCVLATGSHDATVRLWELHEDRLVPLGGPVAGHTGWVWSVAWVQVGQRLLLTAGGRVGPVPLWELLGDRAVARLPSYGSDAPGAVDELGRRGEAGALAELVTARSARPPLAVGLFGDWGEGKSHFLELLHAQVAQVVGRGDVLAHQAVRQVRFNAWHYAESGLWASLVAELFAQLAAPPEDAGDPDPGEAQRSMSRLTAELVAERHLGERLSAARERRDQLNRAVGRGRALFDALPAGQRQRVRVLLGEDGSAERLYRQATGDAAVLWMGARALREGVRGVGRARIAAFLAVCAGVVAGAVGAVWLWDRLPGWVAALPLAVPPLVAAAWALTGARGAWKQVKEAWTTLDRAWKTVRKFADAQRARVQTAADVAQAEVQALEREMQNLTAAGQLAGLISERAAAGDYRSQLGVMTQIREDFQRMAALLARAADPGADPRTAEGPAGQRARDGQGERGDEAGDRLPSVDRIVLYIDDLDRCPPARVVEMLEAVHLLLAVPLFVVVVAIDPRWLLRSVALHYRDILDVSDLPAPAGTPTGPGGETEPEVSTPAQYLEKIFQVVFTLPALDAAGYRQMLRSLVGARADQQPPADPSQTTAPATDAAPDGQVPGGAEPSAEDPSQQDRARDESSEEGVPWVAAVKVIERTDPLTLDPDELALLDLLGPPGLVSTPRGVKRLANSYGLLSALRRPSRDDDLREVPAATAPDGSVIPAYRPYRAGMVLLAALVAYPALGPALCLCLHRQALDDPEGTWADFCRTLKPQRDPHTGQWRNEADPHIPSAQAPQWEALHQALLQVTRSAALARGGLDLPARLAAWRQWVVPAARLSFPAGRIVTALHRQQHQHDSNT